ncbi:SGNH/GDSL hydrolase family protein [Acinetobacter pittii]|uniref:SGNH/GDSL hydrolase family protein n=1 Tax=Acinetobacter pittii TaxID=48296 RepID=UPI0011A8CC83|nr:SGNH/GDSL hydrolase family protein [Acinetobacter pittii]
MKLYKGEDDISFAKIFFRNSTVSRMYKGSSLIYETSLLPYFPRSPLNIGVIGDSTIAAGYGGQLVPSYIPEFTPITSVATPGDTILGQRQKFSSLTNHKSYDVVLMQIGLNDMNVSTQSTATVMANYQSFIDYIRGVVNSRCKIYISQMLPCRQRWFDLYGETNGALSQQRWIDVNYAIEHTFTGVDGRITAHVDILKDEVGNLKAEYDTGDHIHENPAGRQVIATAWKDKLAMDNILLVP